jgi:PAS domain S-box-containing protein
MALPGKELQRRWRKKQEAENKKQVAVMLSKETYKRLKDIKDQTRQNFSTIMDKAVMSLPVTDDSRIVYGRSKPKPSRSTDLSKEFVQTFGPDLSEARVQIGESHGRIHSEAAYKKESEKKLQFVLKNCRDAIWWADIKTDEYKYFSPSARTVFGYKIAELKKLRATETLRLVHPDDRERVEKLILTHKPVDPEEIGSTVEYRTKHPKSGYTWVSTSQTVLFNKKNEPAAIVGITRDIHRRKQTELALQKLHDDLEKKIVERTASLEKANTALTLMLKKEQELKTQLENKILANLKELVLPYMEKLKITRLDTRQKKFLSMMELNLSKIVSPFLRKLSSKFLSLTPAEIQVADMIRHGKTTKEIAELLGLSVRTIESHRANVRKKIGIKNKKTSLRSHLMAFE